MKVAYTPHNAAIWKDTTMHNVAILKTIYFYKRLYVFSCNIITTIMTLQKLKCNTKLQWLSTSCIVHAIFIFDQHLVGIEIEILSNFSSFVACMSRVLLGLARNLYFLDRFSDIFCKPGKNWILQFYLFHGFINKLRK